MTSAIGTKLEVGESVMKNQNIENANTGERRRRIHASAARAQRNTNDAITAGSSGLVDGRMS